MASEPESERGFQRLPETEVRYVAIKAAGVLSDGDYEQFMPVLVEIIEEHRPIRLFVDLTEFNGWSAHALWDDFSFGLRHARDFERIVLVGDARWEALVARMANALMKCDVRHFRTADRQIGWDHILDLD